MVNGYLVPAPLRPIGGHLASAPTPNLSNGRLVVVEMGGTKRFVRQISVTDEEQIKVEQIFKRMQEAHNASERTISFNLSALHIEHYNGKHDPLDLIQHKTDLEELQKIAKEALKRENSSVPEFAAGHFEKSRENSRKDLRRALLMTNWTGRLHAMHDQEQFSSIMKDWFSRGSNQAKYQQLWDALQKRADQFSQIIQELKKAHPSEVWILADWEKKIKNCDPLAICCAIKARIDREDALQSPWLQDQTDALQEEMDQFNQFIQEQPAGPDAANSFFARLKSGFKMPAADPSLKEEEKAYSKDAVLLATRRGHSAARRHFARVTEDPLEWILLEVAQTGSTSALLDHPLFNVKAYPALDQDLRNQYK